MGVCVLCFLVLVCLSSTPIGLRSIGRGYGYYAGGDGSRLEFEIRWLNGLLVNQGNSLTVRDRLHCGK